MYPFERFTERAKKALSLAQQEAERSHHSYIGTEHLLLGLLRVSDGVAAHVLDGLGVDLAQVRSAVESTLGRNERLLIQQIIPTSRVKKVIEIAFEEARRMGMNHVGTEHLLLGLLIESEGIAAHVLQDLGASVETVRQETGRVHAEGGSELAGGEPGEARGEWRRAPVTGSVEAIQREAERLAAEQHTSMGAEHLLLAALDRDPLIRRTLTLLGVDDAKLAELRRMATPPPPLVEMRRARRARVAELSQRGHSVSGSEQEELIRLRDRLEEEERRWRAGEDLQPEGGDR